MEAKKCRLPVQQTGKRRRYQDTITHKKDTIPKGICQAKGGFGRAGMARQPCSGVYRQRGDDL